MTWLSNHKALLSPCPSSHMSHLMGPVCQENLGAAGLWPDFFTLSHLGRCNGAWAQSLEQQGFPHVRSHPGLVIEQLGAMMGMTGGAGQQERWEKLQRGQLQVKERWVLRETDTNMLLWSQWCYSEITQAFKHIHRHCSPPFEKICPRDPYKKTLLV